MGLDMYLEKANHVEGYDDAKDYSRQKCCWTTTLI